ncbi:MAG: hypothetical protein R6U84_07995 [Candidatus Cloacimonadales bacterium]
MNFNLKRFVASLILVLFIASSVFASETDPLNKKISIDAKDAAVSHIISTMAKLSDCNIVLAMETESDEKQQASEKKITIHLEDVPIEQALSLVVKSIGLSYRLIGDRTFLVGQKNRIEEEIGERAYVVELNYVDAAKLKSALEIMPGEITVIDGQNSLLIRANPNTFSEISKKLEEIDVPQKQIEIQARLIEISINEAEKLGVDWSRISQLTTILAEDPVNANGIGLPYNYDDATGNKPHGQLTTLGQLPEDQYFQKMDDFSDVGKFSRQLTAFDITLDWLMENNAAQLLTNTRITAKNGEEAMIHIGEVVPFVVEDNERNIQVEREEVGIKLKVRPTINRNGQITTVLEPEVSSVIELVGGYVPRTKVRKITSTITVPDGKKIVVGGLLNSSLNNQVSRVPFLSRIPFIGKLFTHKYEVLETTDLIIEITPRVVTFQDEDIEYNIDSRLERSLIEIKTDEEKIDEQE